jgi:hypothetical protein
LKGWIYNPSNSGGRDKKDHGWRPAKAKGYLRPYLNQCQLGMVTGAYHPRHMGSISERILFQAWAKNMTPY